MTNAHRPSGDFPCKNRLQNSKRLTQKELRRISVPHTLAMSADAGSGNHPSSKGQRYCVGRMPQGLNAVNAGEKGVTESQLYGNPKNMNIIAISNQKGGTAKTTTAAAFAVLLSRAGFRVHLVDSDPQASLTMAFGMTEPEGLLYQAMCRRGPLPVVTLSDRLSISPCSIDLSRGETQSISEAGREYILQTCLEKTGLDEDTTVILDCPPSLGVLSIGCLTAARYACVVVQPGGFELRTLVQLTRQCGCSTKGSIPAFLLSEPCSPTAICGD